MKDILTNPADFNRWFNTLGCPAIYTSVDGTIKNANDLAIAILQLNPKDYLQKNFYDHCRKKHFHLSSFFERQQAEEYEIKESYIVSHTENWIIKWRKILPSNLLEESFDNDILIVGQDITSEQNALDERNGAISLYEDILSNLPSNVYWKDRNCVYMGCNDRLAQVLGLPSRHAINGKTDFDFNWGSNAAENFVAFDKKVMETGQSMTTEDVFREANGCMVTVLTNKTPLRNNVGDIIGVLAISVDITYLKQLESELKIAKEKTEGANYIMTEFISNMGHDLTTPISDVGSVAQMLSYYKDEYPEMKSLIDTLMSRYEACETVRKRIMTATAVANLNVTTETFSISQELLTLQKELSPFIGEKDLKLIIEPPKPKKADSIETDREKFHDILFDLISNAIQFTEKGQVTVSVLKKERRFEIRVMDTGIGIPADKLDYIFEQYTKLSRSNKYGALFKGVGAGLYLARIRSKLLHAIISVESEVDQGSTFILSIPEQVVQNEQI